MDDIKIKNQLEENKDDDKDGNHFDEGEVDLVHYKHNVSWVVLDEVSDADEQGIQP